MIRFAKVDDFEIRIFLSESSEYQNLHVFKHVFQTQPIIYKNSIGGLWDREETALLLYIDFETIKSEVNLLLRPKNAVSAYLRGVRKPSALVL
jgi:hypothetical protein